MAERDLTTTSYAILGLLSIQPWSTYALTQQMQRSLHHLWPRAESNVYAEPKRLEAAGLVTSQVQRIGKRARTVYTITPAGRAALLRWLETESAPSRLESESLVKVLFGNYGTKDGLLAHVRQVAEEAAMARVFCESVAAEYLRGADPFPERIHLNALIFRWIWEQAEAKARWAEWAIAQVEHWPDTATPSEADAALATFREALTAPHRPR